MIHKMDNSKETKCLVFLNKIKYQIIKINQNKNKFFRKLHKTNNSLNNKNKLLYNNKYKKFLKNNSLPINKNKSCNNK